MSRPTKRFAAYRVTYSDQDGVPVGTVLIDKRWDLHRTWTTVDRKTGKFTEFGGPRIGRLCAPCRLNHGRATELGHDGPCTPETPAFKPEEGS